MDWPARHDVHGRRPLAAAILGRKNRHDIPSNAIIVQLLIVNILLLTRSFEDVVQFTQFSLLLCSLLAVIGLSCSGLPIRNCRVRIEFGSTRSTYRLFDDHHLDDVLSVAVAHCRIPCRRRNSAGGFALVLLRGETSAPLAMSRWNYWTALAVIVGVASAISVCAQPIPETAPRAIPISPTAAGPNDVARFLAGMPVPDNSPLGPLTREPAWQQHAAFFEEQFSKLTLRQLQKLHAWQETNLPESLQSFPVVFYMFSGGFLYADKFFPRQGVVLCGKESMGPPPDPSRIANLAVHW
jgi:hypothetical protein